MSRSRKLILADEPTGNLDRKTGGHVIDLLFGLQRRREATLILVTHDEKLAGALRSHHPHGRRARRRSNGGARLVTATDALIERRAAATGGCR